jgi:hypothetical protein
MAEPAPPRRRVQFRLRTLFVVVTVASLLCGFSYFWSENRRLMRERNEAKANEMKALDAERKASAAAQIAMSPAEDHRAFTFADSWYSPPSAINEFTWLDKGRFAVVAEARQSEAQAALDQAGRAATDSAALLGHAATDEHNFGNRWQGRDQSLAAHWRGVLRLQTAVQSFGTCEPEQRSRS